MIFREVEIKMLLILSLMMTWVLAFFCVYLVRRAAFTTSDANCATKILLAAMVFWTIVSAVFAWLGY